MNTQMNLQRISIDKLKPAKYNPRKDLKPGDPAYEKIKRSLHDFGYVDPVIWNEVTGNIVGGHQRYKVLKAEGVTEIDCVVVHIENPQDEKALNVALNKAVGEWEPKALADLLQDLQLSGYDVGAAAFSHVRSHIPERCQQEVIELLVRHAVILDGFAVSGFISHIVGRIGNHQIGFQTIHQKINMIGIGAVTADHFVPAQRPNIA